MARNRKNESAVLRFEPAIWALLLCAILIGAGVGYVWLKTQIYELSQQQGKRERRLAELRDQNEKLRRQLADLMSPQRLEARMREMKLGLGPPQLSQIWTMTEGRPGATVRPPPASRTQFAAQQARPQTP